jgi:ribosomal protein S18 acetylase RimI-like enzyme
MTQKIIIADYQDPQHSADILMLMEHYAQDPMGGGTPLNHFTRENLTKTLATLPTALSIICYIDDKAIGLINSFLGFSTFKCKPLFNIHDIVVIDDYRGQGICQAMLQTLEDIALEKDCCRLTLEVLEGNHPAQYSYEKYGFKAYELDPAMGKAFFWEKPL